MVRISKILLTIFVTSKFFKFIGNKNCHVSWHFSQIYTMNEVTLILRKSSSGYKKYQKPHSMRNFDLIILYELWSLTKYTIIVYTIFCKKSKKKSDIIPSTFQANIFKVGLEFPEINVRRKYFNWGWKCVSGLELNNNR